MLFLIKSKQVIRCVLYSGPVQHKITEMEMKEIKKAGNVKYIINILHVNKKSE
jgi:hypothetical protein